MQVVRGLDNCPVGGTAATIGAFDGVHLGHHALLRRVRDEATARNLGTALVTFDRHPAQVVRPETAPKLLTTLDQKLELLEATGLVDHTLVLTFDENRRQESAEEFVREVLVDCLQAGLVVVGYDFHFGNQRKGNVALLEAMGAEHGFEVVGLPLVTAGDGPGVRGGPKGTAYSSTAIRQLLVEGNVEAAATLLGRPHEVRGPVIEGDKRGGATLGFPTANVDVPGEICLPADGIYAGRFRGSDGQDRPAAINLGRRPTFYTAGHRLLEAHLLDFDGELYGQQAAVRFVARIRDELRFESVDALIEAMHRDVEAVRAALG
ncbi:MAG: bifunctional riboflavin kinase/FAD synthetase [Acidimicrobiia bacterium]